VCSPFKFGEKLKILNFFQISKFYVLVFLYILPLILNVFLYKKLFYFYIKLKIKKERLMK
jgi:hypothetical protein